MVLIPGLASRLCFGQNVWVKTPAPTFIPGLRSPYDQVGGLVHFGRMLDKIRLHAAGQLPPAWVTALGSATGFDGLCCRFLTIDYPALDRETREGKTDEELLQWAFSHGRKPTEHEIEVWNAYMIKRGWRDQYVERLRFRLNEGGWPPQAVLTLFDFVDLDEGRPLRFSK